MFGVGVGGVRKEGRVGHTDGFLDLWLGPRRRLFLLFTALFNLTAEKQTTLISIKKRKKRRIHLQLAFYHKTYG